LNCHLVTLVILNALNEEAKKDAAKRVPFPSTLDQNGAFAQILPGHFKTLIGFI
jgi:hypothetical protein